MVYVTSDWHGCKELADKVFNFLKPEDTLYFLGDAIDRGSDGIYILDKLLNDSRVVFIKGNHEGLMEEICKNCQNDDDYYLNWDHNEIWEGNGGRDTFYDFMNNSQEKRNWLINKIKKLPKEVCYTNKSGYIIIMNHAGYLNNKSQDNLQEDEKSYLWDRTHFDASWEKEENVFLIHGHTPVQYLKFYYGYKDNPPLTVEDLKAKKEFFYSHNCTYKPTIIRYCGGHKFDIDMCTIASKRVALLNLDTFEEIYIDE